MQKTNSLLQQLTAQLNNIIVGNQQATKLATCCLLAQGHLLIEDIPGVGKTTLAHALAQSFGLAFKRVQFTNDLLPSDILGVSIYDINKKTFEFKKGPIFTSVLLADEINRATAKTQSALLQAMEEKQISVDGKTFDLQPPFFVIATQNPLEQSGTFPLPESQLDRFLMRISLGYPNAEAEKTLLINQGAGNSLKKAKSLFKKDQLKELLEQVNNIHASEALISYLHRLVSATRENNNLINGLSPRAGLQWLQASRAWALLAGRDMVLPEDVQDIAEYVTTHRLHSKDGSNSSKTINDIIQQTAIS